MSRKRCRLSYRSHLHRTGVVNQCTGSSPSPLASWCVAVVNTSLFILKSLLAKALLKDEQWVPFMFILGTDSGVFGEDFAEVIFYGKNPPSVNA